MKLTTFEDLLTHELKDLYSAETQITEALPKMIKAATATELQTAFQTHLQQTEAQLQRLEQIGELLNLKLKGETCRAMEGLIKEGQSVIKDGGEPHLVDAALIGAAQRVEHYEIAAYGTARTYARAMGQNQIADLLQQTLDEEARTDELLTGIAENNVNKKARQVG